MMPPSGLASLSPTQWCRWKCVCQAFCRPPQVQMDAIGCYCPFTTSMHATIPTPGSMAGQSATRQGWTSSPWRNSAPIPCTISPCTALAGPRSRRCQQAPVCHCPSSCATIGGCPPLCRRRPPSPHRPPQRCQQQPPCRRPLPRRCQRQPCCPHRPLLPRPCPRHASHS